MKKIFAGILVLCIVILALCLYRNMRGDSKDTEGDTNSAMANGIDELNYKEIKRVSAYVLGQECFLTEKSLVNDMIGLISRLTPNDLEELPRAEDGTLYEGGVSQLNIYNESELLYSFELIAAGDNTIVRVSSESNCFYCDISDSDEELFHDIYERFYNEFSQESEETR